MTIRSCSACLATALLVGGVQAEARVTFAFDYSLDPAEGVFDASTASGLQARTIMQRAGRVLSDQIVDNLTAITPAAGDAWNPSFTNPTTGNVAKPPITSLGAGVIRISVGTRLLDATAVAMAYAGTAIPTGSKAFTDNAVSRGQPGALATPKTDIGPWGGSIVFDWATDWHVGPTTGTLTPNKMDLFSVALHELVHLLGFSNSQSPFDRLTSTGLFTGPKARAANNGLSPTITGSHWLNMTSRVGAGGPTQTALMATGLPSGTRRRVTLLDWAALDDLGWNLAVPGDANANGIVSFSDYLALERGFGRPDATWATGDFNEDGVVNFTDFRTLYDNFGLRSDGTFSPTAAADRAALASMAAFGGQVPEPGEVSILLLGGWALTARRRRSPAKPAA